MTIGYKKYNLKFKKQANEIDRKKLIGALFQTESNHICRGCGAIINNNLICDYCDRIY